MNNISCVRIIIPTCDDLMQVEKKKSSSTYQSPHKVGSSLHWFALNYSLTAIATARAVRKRNWAEGDGDGDGSLPAYFFNMNGQERWVWEDRDGQVLHVGRERREYGCCYLLVGDFLFSLQG